jgi:hypothetical protein
LGICVLEKYFVIESSPLRESYFFIRINQNRIVRCAERIEKKKIMELSYIMNKSSRYFFLVITIMMIFAETLNAGNKYTGSPILIPEASKLPTIDGEGNDACWNNVPWHSIGHVWIPYGTPMADATDFSGRFKIVWSPKTNLLYFLIEVQDDMFVDGFVPDVTADLYNFDVAEVFIDEDLSGGLHLFDGKGEVAKQWGSNAANAFTYHIYAPFPDSGKISSNPYVSDVAGTSWADATFPIRSSHIPDFALRKEGQTATWEFSLKVYNDTYNENNPEKSRVKLKAGKKIGISVAYCDNDNPQEYPKIRDNMFGSEWEPAPGNMHWMNADYFSSAELVKTLNKEN